MTSPFIESIVEYAALARLAALSCTDAHAPDLASGTQGADTDPASRDVMLAGTLRTALFISERTRRDRCIGRN